MAESSLPQQPSEDVDNVSCYLLSIEYPDASAPIRARSILDLYRAFSVGGLVAFVGSGTSVLLGYDSWKDFAVAFADAALEQRKLYASVAAHGSLAKYCSDLAKSLEALKTAEGRSFDPAAVLSLAREFAWQQDLWLRSIGHAEAGSFDAALEKKLSTLFWIRDSIGVSKDGARWLDYTPADLDDWSIPRVPPYQESGRHAAVDAATIADPTALAPDLVVDELSGLATRAPSATAQRVPIELKNGMRLLGFLLEDKSDSDPQVRRAPVSRKELIAAKRPFVDILACLRNDWRITRYLTLNYDLEIERALEYYDFPFYSLTSPVRPRRDESTAAPGLDWDTDSTARQAVVRSRLGERGRSFDLGPENAGELMLFAAGYPSDLIQVVHLHGSVRDPSRMIVTDSDYNSRYFSPGGWSAALGDGQEMLFRGNAVVFFGVGMKEDELLRPLRLLANSSNRESRTAFAFLESDGDDRDTAVALKLYQRYGVRTLFVGTRLGRDLDPEFGSFSQHPLVDDLRAAAPALFENKDDKAIDHLIASLPPLRDERSVLDAMRALVKGLAKIDSESLSDAMLYAEADKLFGVFVGDVIKVFPSVFRKEAAADSLERRYFLNELYAAHRLPRLRLTPGHAAVFQHIFYSLFSRRPAELRRMRASQQDYLRALDSIEQAIRARALQDALVFFTRKALEWRRRWAYFPRGRLEQPGQPDVVWRRFREPAWDRRHGEARKVVDWRLPSIVTSFDQSAAGNSRTIDGCFGKIGKDIEEKLGKKNTLVLACWPAGRGKGTAAGLLAKPPAAKKHRRWIISFANSCEFDSCFDMLADMLCWLSKDKDHSADCVVLQTDLIFSRNHGVPKLAEWHLMFRKLLCERSVRLLVLCEFPQTSGYFTRLCAELNAAGRAPAPHAACSVRRVELLSPPAAGAAELAPAALLEDLGELARTLVHILGLCESRWLAVFLVSILNGDPLKGAACSAAGSFTQFRTQMLEDIEHGLRLVQDPRQRVVTVIDIAMSHLERRVVGYGDFNERLNKILAHCILKHLFAFGNAIDQDILGCCPEILEILSSYEIESKEHGNTIDRAAKWLVDHQLAVELNSRRTAGSKRRLSLHNQVRRYLASKKGLPFEIVRGREKTALTLLPVLEEEAAPLDADDLVFLGKLFDALIDSGRAGAVAKSVAHSDGAGPATGNGADDAVATASLQAERIRSAFGLMRGSLRIGIVLRAAPTPDQGSTLSPLDEYLRRLLAIRRALLLNADAVPEHRYDDLVWPLYEREWIWLLNELGVVRMVQGGVNDAMPLFELALRFEEHRLRHANESGYDRCIHDKRDFSLAKIRILLNICLAAIECGDFERVERIVRRSRSDLEKLAGVPVFLPVSGGDHTGKHGLSKQPAVHREVSVLLQVCILIDARVAYLTGSVGSVQELLDKHKNDVVELGLHGLTAWFHQILADVQGTNGNGKQVPQSLKIARVEAEASGRPDLILAVMLSEAEFLRDARFADSAVRLRHQLTRLRKIELECKRLGLRRIEVTMCLVRAKLYLSFGELRSAREDVMNALALAKSQGFKVKRIAALNLMAALLGAGEDERLRDQRKEAIELVEAARQEAERIGYKLAAITAKELEIVLRGKGTVEGWASGELARELDVPGAGGASG
ncbi:MAG: SIR2 family protein [Rhodanobacteraceae bacterium]|nr:SIR2 family protein [Rhodanobacteraceae bacterium]